MPLRLRARSLSSGLYTGAHRSLRRGSGIEFGGHRDYVPGDDLRRLDHRALMRHGKLLVREFETETDRSVHLLVDRTASMGFKSESAPGAKLAYASLLVAAMARIALSSGDPVSLDWLGKSEAPRLPSASGREAFERIVAALEVIQADARAPLSSADVVRQLLPVSRTGRRGSIAMVFSDLLDLPDDAVRLVLGLSGKRRTVVVVQVLDPVELTFPFDGTVRLRASESENVVETDARQAKGRYLEALRALQARWRAETERRGGIFMTVSTAEEPLTVLQRLIREIAQAAP
jgi:uncharacterized protein (DUF58 family)